LGSGPFSGHPKVSKIAGASDSQLLPAVEEANADVAKAISGSIKVFCTADPDEGISDYALMGNKPMVDACLDHPDNQGLKQMFNRCYNECVYPRIQEREEIKQKAAIVGDTSCAVLGVGFIAGGIFTGGASAIVGMGILAGGICGSSTFYHSNNTYHDSLKKAYMMEGCSLNAQLCGEEGRIQAQEELHNAWVAKNWALAGALASVLPLGQASKYMTGKNLTKFASLLKKMDTANDIYGTMSNSQSLFCGSVGVCDFIFALNYPGPDDIIQISNDSNYKEALQRNTVGQPHLIHYISMLQHQGMEPSKIKKEIKKLERRQGAEIDWEAVAQAEMLSLNTKIEETLDQKLLELDQ